jgi:hypothetical protein
MASHNEFPIEDVAIDSSDGDHVEESKELFRPDSIENMPVKEDRMFKKAKRSLKVAAKSDDGTAGVRNGLPFAAGSPTSSGAPHARYKSGAMPLSKNSRKSRNMPHGRGQPKKGKRCFSSILAVELICVLQVRINIIMQSMPTFMWNPVHLVCWMVI